MQKLGICSGQGGAFATRIRKSGSVVANVHSVSGIQRIRKTIREGGPSLLFFRICHKLASPVLDFGSTIFFTLDLGGQPETRPRRRSQFVCYQAHLADARGLLDASDPSRSLEQIEWRFRQGQICFAARNDEGRIVHTRWGAPNAINIVELNLDIQLSPGEIYVYDSYTRPEFRGLGVASQLQVFIVDALATMGYSRLVAFVKGDNIPVLRAVKPPHRQTGKLFYLRFFGFNPIIFGRGNSELPQLVVPEKGHRSPEALQYHRK